MKRFCALAFCLYPSLSFATDLVSIDCTVGASTQVIRYVFDANAKQAQVTAPDDKPDYSPFYGRMYVAEVTDTSLTINVPSEPGGATTPTVISRLTGNGERKLTNGNVLKYLCKPASGTLQKAVLTPDSEGAISASCDVVSSMMDKQNVGKSLGGVPANLLIFPQSKEALLYSSISPEPMKYAVGYAGPDFVQLCPGACSAGWIQVNLMNGGGFFVNNVNGAFLPNSDKQLVCKNAPRPAAAQRKF